MSEQDFSHLIIDTAPFVVQSSEKEKEQKEKEEGYLCTDWSEQDLSHLIIDAKPSSKKEKEQKEKEEGCLCTDWSEPMLRNCIHCDKEYMGIQGQTSLKNCPLHRSRIGCICDFGLVVMCDECCPMKKK